LGGIIPDDDREKMLEVGVYGIFGPGANTDDIVAHIRQLVTKD
jgi:methylmalonyl-CoA mutase cobalamin-binding domain/chain